MPIVQTLAPLVLLISLGAGLSRVRFLGRAFMADLNKLVFWVAMPALLFQAAAHASSAGGETARLVGVMLVATTLISAATWVLSPVLGVPRTGRGTLVQAAFRGNLAFIGIPVMASTFDAGTAGAMAAGLTTAVVTMTLTMSFYNVLAVLVLQASRVGAQSFDRLALVRSIGTNPLLIAGLSGLLVAALGVPLPAVLDRTLETLGGAAVPIALLCIGSSLVTARLDGRRSWIVCVALLKVAVVPVLVWWLSRAAGLGPVEHRIAVVFGACPTAAAAYIMAREMDGDEVLASGSIAMSTVLSVVSLAVVLWLTE